MRVSNTVTVDVVIDVTILSIMFDSLIIDQRRVIIMFVYLCVGWVVIVSVTTCHLLNELLENRSELLFLRVTEAVVEGLEDDDTQRLNQLSQRGTQ